MSKTIKTEPILITLCGSCASQFYNTNKYRMQRADNWQINKEECTYCGCRRGYDYLLYPKKEQRDKNRRMRHYAKGGTCECFVRTEY